MEQNFSGAESKKVTPEEFLNARHALATDRAAMLSVDSEDPREAIRQLAARFMQSVSNESEPISAQ